MSRNTGSNYNFVRKYKKFIIPLLVIGLAYFLVFQFVVKGEPYQFAVEYIKTNKVVVEKIGEVKDTSLSFFSSLSYRGLRGKASYKIFVYGVKGEGKIYIDMERMAGRWRIIEANLILKEGTMVNIRLNSKGEKLI